MAGLDLGFNKHEGFNAYIRFNKNVPATDVFELEASDGGVAVTVELTRFQTMDLIKMLRKEIEIGRIPYSDT